MSADTELGPVDTFADPSQTREDVRILEAVREAKKRFFDDLVKGSADQDDYFLTQLRQEPTYQMAEFYYLLRAFNLDSNDKVANYARLHNRYLTDLGRDREKMRRLGLREDRIHKGIFTEESILKLIENYKKDGSTFDQSDLSRLLTQLMSPETCRKIVVVLAEAGYLERWKSPYQSILVRSTGALEELFARQLRALRLAITTKPD